MHEREKPLVYPRYPDVRDDNESYTHFTNSNTALTLRAKSYPGFSAETAAEWCRWTPTPPRNSRSDTTHCTEEKNRAFHHEPIQSHNTSKQAAVWLRLNSNIQYRLFQSSCTEINKKTIIKWLQFQQTALQEDKITCY